MAGGKGTRLASISKEIPKPMFPICGKPIIEYQIDSLVRSGITTVTLIVGFQKEIIISYFGDGSRFGVKINYIEEKEPLGTAGSLYYLKSEQEDFILLFGDLILDVDFNRFMEYHRRNDALITLYCHPNSHPYDSDVIQINKNNKVIGILSKKLERKDYYCNFVNAGVYCINPRVLDALLAPTKIDLEKSIVVEQIKKGNVYAYKSTEYVKDMGTPARLISVEKDIVNGIVSGRSLKNKQKAIFLDRDGTINKYVGLLKKIEDFELLEGVAEAISMINASTYLCIVATNQPVIARGEMTVEQLERIHMRMETELGEKGAYLDEIYFCPHHPDKGYAGEISELKINCECRKPKIGMLQYAAMHYNIDLEQSWIIGDTTMDVQTGVNAGMKTVLVKTGVAGTDGKYDVKPDYIATDLKDAVEFILMNCSKQDEVEKNDQLY